MERYTVRQVNRALAQEQLLQRLSQGEGLEQLCQELGLSLEVSSLPYLRRRYRQGGCTWMALVDHRQGHSYKVTPERRVWLRQQKQDNPALTQKDLVQRFEAEFAESISQSQVSNILRAEGVAMPGGQHYPLQGEQTLPIDRAGVFFPSGGSPSDEGIEYRHRGGTGADKELPRN